MDMNCCPDDGIMQEIETTDCPFDLKQIQRLAFATRGKVIWDSGTGGGAGDGVPQLNSQVDTLADWQLRLSAVDNTKIIVTPLIGGDPIIEAGEAITEGGGDNSTLNGVEDVTGTNPSKFSCTFKSIAPVTEVGMKKVKCKTAEVYFFNENGDIICRKIEGTTHHRGFIMQSYFFSDRGNAGFGTKDKHMLSFSLPSGWSEDLVIVKPADFNPLYDL